MDLFTDNRPETCANVDLDCDSCVQRCAATTASICGGLLPSGAHKVFFQLYPSSACHPMAESFVRAYQDAVTPAKPIPVMTRAARATAAAA